MGQKCKYVKEHDLPERTECLALVPFRDCSALAVCQQKKEEEEEEKEGGGGGEGAAAAEGKMVY